MTRSITPLLPLLLAVPAVLQAASPELQDPMRPPTAVQRAIDLRHGTAGPDAQGAAQPLAVGQARAAGQPAPGASEAASAKPRVLAPSWRTRVSAVVLADHPGRDAALIDGRIAYVGDKVGGATLARIEAQGVTLRDPKGRLSFLPLIARAPVSPEAAAESASAPVFPPSGAAAPGKELP